MSSTETKQSASIRRPYARRYGRAIRVRLPIESEQAIRAVRRVFKISLSQTIRASLQHGLAGLASKAIEIAQDERQPPGKRVKMLNFLQECAICDLAFQTEGPDLLKNFERRSTRPGKTREIKAESGAPNPIQPG